MRRQFNLRLPSGCLELGKKTLIMGILNVTPDSFFDGGCYEKRDLAFKRGMQLEDEGADFIDVGGESTRPARKQVLSVEEETKRVVPIIECLAKRLTIPISVDTYKFSVARQAIDAGAEIINDISGLNFDSRMAELVFRSGVAIVLMHSRGRPEKLHGLTPLKYPMQSVIHGLGQSVKKALQAGIHRNQLIIDPGLGFGKETRDNLILLKKLHLMKSFHLPCLIGPSRKSYIGQVLNFPVKERLIGTLASIAVSVTKEVHVVRVHDVKEAKQVVKLCDAIFNVKG